ncbi:hypothetical protein RRG08_029819 [Elysia crispata]|uniref:Uncharacterized protein n=1 Tax=Elysia crispata TaxID=231223 RepID=A0AAE1D105_9GAST|nr:hypothetical protein RRG08_029819 [Elysia crispata]
MVTCKTLPPRQKLDGSRQGLPTSPLLFLFFAAGAVSGTSGIDRQTAVSSPPCQAARDRSRESVDRTQHQQAALLQFFIWIEIVAETRRPEWNLRNDSWCQIQSC